MRPRLCRLQATTVAHRVARPARRRWFVGRTHVGPEGDVTPATNGVVPGPPSAAEAVRQMTEVGLPRDVVVRASIAGRSAEAVVGLADVWSTLGPDERAGVARPLGREASGPVRLGGHLARQSDGTTCGSAVLTMLAAAGDPFLALWLVTGRLVADGSGGLHRPPELRGARTSDLAVTDARDRFASVERAVKRASTRGALGPFPWPGALGTPPWGAARTARFPGVSYTPVMVDDTDTGHLEAVLHRVDAALEAGVPVPLYTGGDLSRGVAAAVPRHVVLLVPRPFDAPAPAVDEAPHYAVYEPGGGRMHRLARADLVAPSGPRAALGGWSHVCWAVLPMTTSEVRRTSARRWRPRRGRTTMESSEQPDEHDGGPHEHPSRPRDVA